MEPYKIIGMAFIFLCLFIVFLICSFCKNCWKAFKKGWDSE